MNFAGRCERAGRSAFEATRRFADDLIARAREGGGWMQIGLIALAVVLFAAALPLTLAVLAIGLIGFLIWAWIHEFVILMNLRDGDFPGRFDKLVWSILMVLLPPIGLAAFWTYRRSRTPDPTAAAEKPARDEWA